MNDLLNLALTAHGGLDRWNQLATVRLHASITGAIWYVKGKPDALKDVVIEADLRNERLTMDFPGQNKRSIFEPDRIVLETADGEPLARRDHPETSFAGHTRDTSWDDIHAAFFSGEALWTYLTIPFLFTYRDVATEEVPLWHENGEQWRRLKVLYPENIVTHNREAVAYFGEDGLLRRYDYTVDILGGATGANYATNYKSVDGIVVPTTRRIYARDEAQNKVPEPLLVAIDMTEISFNKPEAALLGAA
jgi:hypothetical protein